MDTMHTKGAASTHVIDRVGEEGWTYIKTVVDVVHEPVLMLDKDLRVIAANDPFYRTFQVEPVDTEGAVVYALGNGQWDIPALRKLLEEILPNNTFFKGFQVEHIFPVIGPKTMILNARQIYLQKQDSKDSFPPIILLAIEDVTEMMQVAEMLAGHANGLEGRLAKRTEKLELQIKALEKTVRLLTKKPS